jgi:GT2 family glycosyltransferase
MADVSAVIGNYAGESHLPACVESLRRQTLPLAEIVVVDASSPDRSAEVARRLAEHVLIVPNRGLGFLYNRGVEIASAPYILLSNVDVSYDERCVELLAAALGADERRFAADARQLDWEGERVVHAWTQLRRGRLLREYVPGLHLDHRLSADTVVPTVNANAAAMLVRRDRFLELGGFDETFFMDWEDLDLCWRAWLHGWPTVYVPDACLRHKVGAVTSAEVAPRREASSHHNILRFALKCLPARAAGRVVAGELLRSPRYPRSIPRAFAALVRELPEILRLRRAIRPSSATLKWMLEGQPQ